MKPSTHEAVTESLRSNIRIVHIANLGLTLERFVKPLSTCGKDGVFEHLYVHADSSNNISDSAINISFGRSKIGILKAWSKAKENAEKLVGVHPDIIHIHTPATALALIPSLRKVKKNRIKVVYTARGGFDEGGSLTRKFLWHFLDPLKWGIWDGVCVVNDHLLGVAESSPHRVQRKISIGAAAPNWNSTASMDDHAHASLEEDPLRLVWVGRLAKDKRLQDFLNLISALNTSLPGGCFGEVVGASLEGDGKGISATESDHIAYHGWLESPSVIVSRCDLLISTSTREGYGLAPLEAALVGTPTIAVANHGTRESVPLIGGLLIRPHRLDEMVDAIHQYSKSSSEWKTLNRARVRQIARELMAESNPQGEMVDFYNEVISS